MTAVELAADVRSGRRSAVDVIDEHLDRIDARDGDIHAFVTDAAPPRGFAEACARANVAIPDA